MARTPNPNPNPNPNPSSITIPYQHYHYHMGVQKFSPDGPHMEKAWWIEFCAQRLTGPPTLNSMALQESSWEVFDAWLSKVLHSVRQGML